MSRVWRNYPGGGSKLLTLLALADYGNDEGSRIYPSADTLAKKIRMSERQARRILKELVSEGIITIINDGNKGGAGQSNHIQINLKTLTNCPGYAGDVTGNVQKTLTNPVKNPDIAMSDEPLEPLNNRYPDKSSHAVQWGPERESKIVALKSYIRQLEKTPENIRPPDELERAKSQLNEILLKAGKI